jgi:hypothetical protein
MTWPSGSLTLMFRMVPPVGPLLPDARYAGLIDWSIIEDRGREPYTPSEWDTIGELVESALRAYRLPRWAGQKYYAELWVEKQALAGVLQPLASKYHVTLMVNKGYSSASAMKESADRMQEACGYTSDVFTEWHENAKEQFAMAGEEEADEKAITDEVRESFVALAEEHPDIIREPVIGYLGDHDPSGEDMVRDIRDRLREFGVLRLQVQKLALNMDQIKKWNPPPNPAKLTDSRAKAYIEKFGEHSWELDALPPRELTRIVEKFFTGVIDIEKMHAIMAQEELDKAELRKAAEKIMKKRKS